MELESNLNYQNGALPMPFSWIVSGPSNSGKTMLVMKTLFLENDIVEIPDIVYWYYGIWQDAYDKIKTKFGKKVVFVHGVPDRNFVNSLDTKKKNVVVLDDLMFELSLPRHNQVVTPLFTRGSHHANLTVIVLVQNLFSKNLREMRLNATYLTLFANPADVNAIRSIARQVAPSNVEGFLNIYKDATSKKFGYLFIDLRPQSSLRYRTDLLQEVQIIYKL